MPDEFRVAAGFFDAHRANRSPAQALQAQCPGAAKQFQHTRPRHFARKAVEDRLPDQSGVGRTSKALWRARITPPALPPMMRMGTKFPCQS